MANATETTPEAKRTFTLELSEKEAVYLKMLTGTQRDSINPDGCVENKEIYLALRELGLSNNGYFREIYSDPVGSRVVPV